MHCKMFCRITWLASAGLSAEMRAAVKDLMLRVDVRDRAGRLVPHKSSFFGKVTLVSSFCSHQFAFSPSELACPRS